tara:strand:+ start:30035 stop:33799 length:3765 start_codon:yes stop_codon:yes gene_type:complete
MIEGAGLLPHVYCRKIILDREKVIVGNNTEQKTANITVTLNLEMLANATNVHSSWLGQYAPPGPDGKKSSLFNSLFVQIVPVVNVDVLKPSNDPLSIKRSDDGGNIYVAGAILGKNWLPRGPMSKIIGIDSSPEVGYVGKHSLLASATSNLALPPPVQIATSTAFGGQQPLDLQSAISQGKVRQEVRKGKPYYIVPIEYRYTIVSPEIAGSSLGFMFYSLLHVPHFLQANFNNINDDSVSKFEDYIIEGPVNSEIVFDAGDVLQNRESFFMPGGEIWEGSVHLHGPDNPDPSGYFGDGSFGYNRGWMVGQLHIPGASQPKLELVEYPNYKIDDFRGSLIPPTAPNVLGVVGRGDRSTLGPRPELQLKQIGKELGSYEKKTKKYFTRDNDDEYSKLYLTRDASGGTRGLFFIDFDNLLKNNSTLYSDLRRSVQGLMSDTVATKAQQPLWAPEVLSNSRLIELKVYRDRINEHTIGRNYKKFKDDTSYEEPSKLIAVIGDQNDYGTTTPSPQIHELSLSPGTTSKRFFSFSDLETKDISAGVYQYRVELHFKDGTYHFLNKFLHELKQARRKLDKYYNLSLSGVRSNKLVKNYRADLISKEHRKSFFKPYYNMIYRTFEPEFISEAQNVCKKNSDGLYIWETAIDNLNQCKLLLSDEFIDTQVNNTLASMINPEFGSPEGIELFIKFFDTAIKKIQTKTGANKQKPGGSDLTENNSSGQTNNLDELLSSPALTTIIEHHTFDNPRSLNRVDSTNTVFVDYLGDGLSTITNVNFFGLKNLSVEYFRARCQLDACKFTGLAKDNNSFANTNIGLLVPDTSYYNSVERIKEAQQSNFSGPDIRVIIDFSDNLSSTAYSYLTPSSLYYRDSSKRSALFFSSFANNSVSRVLSNNFDVLAPEYFFTDYDGLFAELVSYTITKKENKHSDVRNLNNPIMSKPSIGTYKGLLARLGITFHEKLIFNKFFDKEPGAVNGRIDGTVKRPFSDIYPLGADQYSDAAGYGEVEEQLTNYFGELNKNSSIVKIPTPDFAGVKSGYVEIKKRPNNFKMVKYMNNRINYGVGPEVNDILRSKLENPQENKSFIFFHYNMTVAVEVFTGFSYDAIPKEDNTHWRLLTNDDLIRVSSDPRIRLFCRLKFYKEKNIDGIDIPIINEYFTISDYSTPNHQQVIIPLELGFKSSVVSPASTALWRKQNQQHSIGNLTAQSQQVQENATQASPASGAPQIQLAPGQQLNQQGQGSSMSGGSQSIIVGGSGAGPYNG